MTRHKVLLTQDRIFILYYNYFNIFCTPLIGKAVKEKVNIYSTDSGRIPQNLMSADTKPWIQKGVVFFTVYPEPHDGKTNDS